MTSRQRMLAAYANRKPDRVPVSPELWYDIPVALSGVPFEEVALGHHHLWRIQLEAHRYFGTDAWIVGFPGGSSAGPKPEVTTRRISAGELEIRSAWETSSGRLVRVTDAGRRESHPHDVTMTKDAPNYKLGER